MTNEISLRDVVQVDLVIFFEHQLDSDANQMAAFTREDPSDRIAFTEHWNRIMDDPEVIIKTIISDEEIAGYILSYAEEDVPEVNYWIGKRFWGQGNATQALSAILARVNRTRPIYARVAKDNLGSLRVLQKCGFAITSEDKGIANARGEEVEEWILRLDTDYGDLKN